MEIINQEYDVRKMSGDISPLSQSGRTPETGKGGRRSDKVASHAQRPLFVCAVPIGDAVVVRTFAFVELVAFAVRLAPVVLAAVPLVIAFREVVTRLGLAFVASDKQFEADQKQLEREMTICKGC